MTPQEFIEALKKVDSDFRYKDVNLLSEQVDPSQFKEEKIIEALDAIRAMRLFPELEKTTSLFFMSGQNAPFIRSRYAQALIEQHRLKQGLSVLNTLLNQEGLGSIERSETIGLLGRVYKQLYVIEGDLNYLKLAIQNYRLGWHEKKGFYRWHGINLAALLSRANREGIGIRGEEKATIIASEILTEIKALQGNASMWDHGTAMEACIALGDSKETIKWLGKYARNKAISSFMLGSTIRQLKEVWLLEETHLGKEILPILEYELLQREGAVHVLSKSKEKDPASFEAVYGTEGVIYLDWIHSLYQSCDSIARVSHITTGQPYGTGFVLRGSSICKQWKEDLVFLTNAHVISNSDADEAPLRPEEAAVEFTRSLPGKKMTLGEVIFSSPRHELDVSILKLPDISDLIPLNPHWYQPIISKPDKEPQRIYVIGHAGGRNLSVSLYDNKLLSFQNHYVHYRSPTEGGSSGAPVFTRNWNVLAIHHAAREEKQLNEGILLAALRKKLDENLF